MIYAGGMELHERQKSILEALIREYVKTAKPVSSKDLLKTHKFPFSSATIRNDFQILADLGYVQQPHISAGRIPTDKAYRFYIHENEHKGGAKNKSEKKIKALRSLTGADPGSDEEFLRSAGAILSELSEGFTTAGIVDDRIFFKHGFSEILGEPEFLDHEWARDFGHYIDDFEKSADMLAQKLTSQRPEAFVGKENPIRDGKEYGMVVYAYERDTNTGKKKQIVSILGPKRMDYERNILLMEEFDEVVRQVYFE